MIRIISQVVAGTVRGAGAGGMKGIWVIAPHLSRATPSAVRRYSVPPALLRLAAETVAIRVEAENIGSDNADRPGEVIAVEIAGHGGHAGARIARMAFRPRRLGVGDDRNCSNRCFFVA